MDSRAEKRLDEKTLDLAFANRSQWLKKLCLSLTAWSLFALTFVDDIFAIDEYIFTYFAVSCALTAFGLAIVAISLPSYETGIASDKLEEHRHYNAKVFSYLGQIMLSGGIILRLGFNDRLLLDSEIIDCNPFLTLPTFSYSLVVGFFLHAYFMGGKKWEKWLLCSVALILGVFSITEITANSPFFLIAAILSVVVGVGIIINTIPTLTPSYPQVYICLLFFIGFLIVLLVRNELIIWLIAEGGTCRNTPWFS